MKKKIARGVVTDSGPSRDDWLKALDDAGVMSIQDDRQAVTVNEFASMMGFTHMTASRRLQALAAAGKATRTIKVALVANNRRFPCVAYRLK